MNICSLQEQIFFFVKDNDTFDAELNRRISRDKRYKILAKYLPKECKKESENFTRIISLVVRKV